MPSVNYIVTAEAAQATAEFQRFEASAVKAYADIATASTRASATMVSQAQISARTLKQAIGGIALNASFFLGPEVTQAVYPLMLLQKEFKGIKSALSLLPGASALAGVSIAALTAAVIAGATAWSAYKAKTEEARTSAMFFTQQGDIAGTLDRLIGQNKNRLKPGEAAELLKELRTGVALGGDALIQAVKDVQFRLGQVLLSADQKKIFADLSANAGDYFYTTRTQVQQLQDGIAEAQRQFSDLMGKAVAAATTPQDFNNLNIQQKVFDEAKAIKTLELELARFRELAELSKKNFEEEDVYIAKLTERQEKENQFAQSRVDIANARAGFLSVAAGQPNQAGASADAEAKIDALNQQEALEKKILQESVADQELAEAKKTAITEKYAHLRAQIVADEELRKTAVQRQASDATVDMLGSAAQAARLFGAKGFAAFKAFSIAQATVSAVLATMRALADVPYPANLFVAAAAAAAGAVNVATIAATQPSGYAAGGYTGDGGKFEIAGPVHKGEWVMPAETVNSLGKQNMAMVQSGKLPGTGSSGERTITQNIHNYIDRQEWLNAIRDDVEGIATEAMKRNLHRFRA